ncbi:hypothetical protein J7M28_10100 [bacterium]|nr:hypothetical protein [bacterium]
MGIWSNRIATFALLSFIIASLAYMIANAPKRPSHSSSSTKLSLQETGRPMSAEGEIAKQVPDTQELGDVVVVYYFHSTWRSYASRLFESMTLEAMEGEFAEAIRAGLLKWRPISTDKPENEHFLDDYQLDTKSIVVAEYRGGKRTRYKVLQRAWPLLREKRKFSKYIREEIRAYMS